MSSEMGSEMLKEVGTEFYLKQIASKLKEAHLTRVKLVPDQAATTFLCQKLLLCSIQAISLSEPCVSYLMEVHVKVVVLLVLAWT